MKTRTLKTNINKIREMLKKSGREFYLVPHVGDSKTYKIVVIEVSSDLKHLTRKEYKGYPNLITLHKIKKDFNLKPNKPNLMQTLIQKFKNKKVGKKNGNLQKDILQSLAIILAVIPVLLVIFSYILKKISIGFITGIFRFAFSK